MGQALSSNRLYVDLRTSEKKRANWQGLVNRIDSEVRRLRGMASDKFDSIDKDQSGDITFAEFSAAQRKDNPNITDEQVQSKFDAFDVNHDKSVSRQEFLDAKLTWGTSSSEDTRRRA